MSWPCTKERTWSGRSPTQSDWALATIVTGRTRFVFAFSKSITNCRPAFPRGSKAQPTGYCDVEPQGAGPPSVDVMEARSAKPQKILQYLPPAFGQNALGMKLNTPNR